MIRARQQQKRILVRFVQAPSLLSTNQRQNALLVRAFSSAVSDTTFVTESTTGVIPSETHNNNIKSSIDKKRMKQEALEAHHLRQREQQQLKQDKIKKRQEAHLKLTILQKLQSTVQSQSRRRAEAAKVLGPLLRISPTCYQDTMAALDLSTFHPKKAKSNSRTIQDGNKKNSRKARRQQQQQQQHQSYWTDVEMDDQNVMQHNDGLNLQYRQLYMQSINSFIKCLQTDPASLFPHSTYSPRNTHTPISIEMEQSLKQLQDYEKILSAQHDSLSDAEKLLDKLVDSGFSDGRFAKNYRKMKVHEITTNQLNSRIEARQKELVRRKQKLQSSEELLLKTEEEFAIKKQQRRIAREQEKESKKNEGLISSFINSLSDIYILLAQSKTDDGDRRKRKLSPEAVRRKEYYEDVTNLKLLSNKVKERKRKVQNTENFIIRLESEMEYPPRSIPLESFQRADETVQHVLKELSPSFATHIQQRHAELVEYYRVLDGMTDLSTPHEWYKQTRKQKRKIIYHGGSTNSGKTYTALERLKSAKKGLYLGPLRLLAAEVYERLTADGITTNLYTGQEVIEVPGATHSSATTEIGPLNEKFDVVVIDEIQMINDPYRGHAWTRALQGIQCKEIHVCGGMEALNIVEKIVDDCGDELEVKDEYKRFSNLYIAENSFTEESGHDGYKMVEPGDCIVAFSRNDIFAIKREIESNTNHTCSVIYGSLPPEIRMQQAQRFNDVNSDHNILIASDAIGMGLNLNIKRIIFNTMLKSDGEKIIQLPHTGVKQISGRAGRRSSPYPDGIVTCRNPDDMEYLRQCMEMDVPSIEEAGLLPTSSSIQEFSHALSTLKINEDYDDLYVILQKFTEMATLQGDFFLCRQTPILRIAKFLAEVPLSLADKYTFCMAPVKTDDPKQMEVLKDYAFSLSRNEVRGMKAPNMPTSPRSFEDISRLCTIHSELELFMWLCLRYPENFVFEQTSLAVQERTIYFINQGLVNSDNLKLDHCYKQRDSRLRKSFAERQEKEMFGDSEYSEFA